MFIDQRTNKMRASLSSFVASMPKPVARLVRGLRRAALNLQGREAVFARIARQNSWDGTESVSGPGSTLMATANIRAALPEIIREHDIQSILDIPCGDAYWISRCLPKGVHYTGADIVPELIQKNLREKREVGDFCVLDLVSDDLPPNDLLIVRDCFIHLPNSTVMKAIANIKQSDSRLILLTHFPKVEVNIDIEVGGFRAINLLRPPFSLPEPILLIRESDETEDDDKHIGLWYVQDI